ncbi:MAG TPA: hypothetical protein VHC45_16130 [Gaiellaceae bacterium]|jgi:hypothetical protein|nr:hypothetical protein [Gaiellaceae bacterium]
MATPPAPPTLPTPALAGAGGRRNLADQPALDGVRGVAVLAAIASHTGYRKLERPAIERVPPLVAQPVPAGAT